MLSLTAEVLAQLKPQHEPPSDKSVNFGTAEAETVEVSLIFSFFLMLSKPV